MNKIFPIILVVVLSGYSQESISAKCDVYTNLPGHGSLIESTIRLINEYARLANIAKSRGNRTSYNKALYNIRILKHEMRKLNIEKAISDLQTCTYGNQPVRRCHTARISKLWSDYSGRDVSIVLRTDCRFNIYHFGKIYKEGISGNTVIEEFKQLTD